MITRIPTYTTCICGDTILYGQRHLNCPHKPSVKQDLTEMYYKFPMAASKQASTGRTEYIQVALKDITSWAIGNPKLFKQLVEYVGGQSETRNT